MELPKLPEPAVHHPGYSGVSYTAEQMTEYARLAIIQTTHIAPPELMEKVRKAVKYQDNGDPARDAIDEVEMVNAMRLLVRIVDI